MTYSVSVAFVVAEWSAADTRWTSVMQVEGGSGGGDGWSPGVFLKPGTTKVLRVYN